MAGLSRTAAAAGLDAVQAPTLVTLALALTLGGCSLDHRGLSGATVVGPTNSPGAAGAGGNPGTGGIAVGGQGGSGDVGSGGTGGGSAGAGGGSAGAGGGSAGAGGGAQGGSNGAGGTSAGGSGGGGAGGAGGSAGAAGGGGGSTVDAAAGGAGGSSPDAGTSDAGTISVIGCADGTREGYTNVQLHPRIAACSGAWSIPGLIAAATLTPACDRQAGNTGTSTILDGAGCSVADLCAQGWHVCLSAAELTQLGETCAPALAASVADQVFFATRQRGNANGLCVAATNANTTNNVHGCGNFGSPENPAQSTSCTPLTPFMLEQPDCFAIVGWACGTDPNSTTELDDVTKPSAGHGGVLCCHD
jgi:hypothetical protein